MRSLSRAAIFLLPALACAGPAQAASSEWHDAQGAKIRLVTTSAPDEENRLRGALQIRLDPGWKTYWRDPGDAGVPPSLSAAVGSVEIDAKLAYPAPKRFDDGYSITAGYDEPVFLPVTFDLGEAGISAPITADVFLGVCETICIPVQAHLVVDVQSGAAKHSRIVDAAFEGLPEDESRETRAWIEKATADQLVVRTAAAGAEVIDLFVASTDTHSFGAPERVEGGTAFAVPILSSHPSSGPDEVFYTLVTSAGAVSGTLRLE